MDTVPTQKDAKKFRKCGGRAFPTDYNWTCPKCERENRAFEMECGYCRHDADTPAWAYKAI